MSKVPEPVIIPDDILSAICPDNELFVQPTNMKDKIGLPEGFVLKTLEPTGGKIAKPKEWYCVEQHLSVNSLNWVISKENPDQGPYETGLRIQFLLALKKEQAKPQKNLSFHFLMRKRLQ